jgi:penicillin-insensitive murein DD-endopeptidase
VRVIVATLFLSALLTESVSVGTPARGSLRDGVSFAASGRGFVAYSTLGNLAGRQYVHSRVHAALVEAFASLHEAAPARTFVLGETGLKAGGRFRPHRTHQNGLSVDIFMPVRDGASRPVPMPTAPWNRFGYSLEFDATGRGEGLVIDFASVAELLVEVDRRARLHGLAIDRIIVAPEYVDQVLSAGPVAIRELAPRFMRKPAWVRHDEHLHLDFRVLAARRQAGAAPRGGTR